MTQIPGGWLANRVGGHRVYVIGIAVTAVLTILTPPLANIHVYLLLAVRIIEGLFEVSFYLILSLKIINDCLKIYK